ncbi:aspartate aminotransferase family protein [Fusibacter bizertensis]
MNETYKQTERDGRDDESLQNRQDSYMSPDEIIALKANYFYPNTMHFYQNPPHIVKGEMQYLYDHMGVKYTDFFAGVTVLNCGHSNPEILDAVHAQLNRLQHTSIIYLTEPMVKLAKALAEVLPGDIQSTFFCNSGTEANEGALLLARMHTGKKGFIAFEGGLHGRSHLTMSVTGIPMWRIDPFLEPDVYFASCFTQVGMSSAAASEVALEEIQSILEAHGNEIAALIVEPIQGNGGMNTPPSDFFVKLGKLLKKHDVLMIVDEVQTGFARTGSWFAIEQFGVVPDIITYAKALGNGIPIGAFSARPEVAKSFNKPSASTLGGNPVSSAAGLAVLDYMKKGDLCGRSKVLGEVLREGLETLKKKHNLIKDVRGMGLMQGAVLDADAGATVDVVLEEMKKRGFIIGKNGLHRNVLAFQPPLVIEEMDIKEMLIALDETLSALPTA